MSVFKEPTTHKTPALDVTLRAYVRTYVGPSARRVLRVQHPAESRGDADSKKHFNCCRCGAAQIPIHTFPTSERSPVVIFN